MIRIGTATDLPTGIDGLRPYNQELTVKAKSDAGKTTEFKVICRIDTPAELQLLQDDLVVARESAPVDLVFELLALAPPLTRHKLQVQDDPLWLRSRQNHKQ